MNCQGNHIVFVFLCLTYVTYHNPLKVHACWHMCQDFLPSYEWIIFLYAAAAAKSLQSCPTLCDPLDGSPPGSHLPGILQARTLEWVAISFSNARKWKVNVKMFSRVQLLATPWTAAYQAPPSVGFSRQEYWSGVPLPPLCLFIEDQNLFCKLGLQVGISCNIFV